MQKQNSNHKIQNGNITEEKTITIDAELVLPLGELVTYIFKEGKDDATIIDILEKQPESVNQILRKIACDVLSKKRSEVNLQELKFDYCDSDCMTNGISYFKVKLEGTEKALKKIAGEDKTFTYDWEEHQHAN